MKTTRWAILQAHGREMAESIATVLADLKAKPLVSACMPLLATFQIAGAAALAPLEPALLKLLHLLCSGEVCHGVLPMRAMGRDGCMAAAMPSLTPQRHGCCRQHLQQYAPAGLQIHPSCINFRARSLTE